MYQVQFSGNRRKVNRMKNFASERINEKINDTNGFQVNKTVNRRQGDYNLSAVFLFPRKLILLRFYTDLLTDFTVKTYNRGAVKR